MSAIRTELCLIRHGQTTWNRDGLWQGQADPELTPLGFEQARALARALSGEQGGRPWTRLYASDLRRARETAVLIGEALGLAPAVDARLRELDVGEWSGLARRAIEARHAALLAAFERGDPDVRPGGGETRIEIRERSHAFVRDLAERHPGERILVVTHLGVIRALVPGAAPQNADRLSVVAEALAARPVDRTRRPEPGPL